jgi:hypothetical protein
VCRNEASEWTNVTETTLEVDGERFRVQQSAADPYQLNFTWFTAPNRGYGFSSGTYETKVLGTDDQRTKLEWSIRNFLSQVNAATGYID